MMLTYELYLTKKYVTKEEWLDFIKIISKYNKLLRRWKIIVSINENKIRYFVKSKWKLPPSINNLDSFLIKSVDLINIPKTNFVLPFYFNASKNIIDIINYMEIKNKGSLDFIEITLINLGNEKIYTKCYFYTKKNELMQKYRLLLSVAPSLLSVDFEGNKRYFYKSAPKYLEMNKSLDYLEKSKENALLEVDPFPYLNHTYYLSLDNFSFNKHSVIIGSSGSGKSKFISLLINNIYQSESLKEKYKVVLIDPHADLENDIGGIGKTIDFLTIHDSIDLFINKNEDIISAAELLLNLLKSLIGHQYNSKLERVLRHSIYLLLTKEEFNFKNLRKVLLDLEYRNELLKNLRKQLPTSVINFFYSDFNELKTKSYNEAISPIIGFIDEMEMIPVFNTDNKAASLKDTIDNNFLTLFSLNRIKLGEKVTKTIAGLIMQQLFSLVQHRDANEHIIFIIDEVAVLENPIIGKFLSEARKYNLSLILVGQYFNQISESLKNSIFANVINFFIFRVSKLDANVLVDCIDIKIPLDDSRERKLKLLTELNSRECIARIETQGKLLPAFMAKTMDFKSIPRIKKDEHISKNINDKKNNDKRIELTIDSNVSLHDILLSTSTKKGVY